MRLLIDIGNTETTIGLSEGAAVRGRWRLTSSHERTPDEWSVAIDAFVVRAGHAPAEIRSACLASVVPSVTQAVVAAIQSALTPHVGQVLPGAALPLVLDVDEPLAVGADRIANALAVLERHPGDTIVVDLGTATTFDCVTADRRFIGGAIMPGLRTSADQLVRRAAKLTATELIPPAHAIGRRTDEHIRAGVLFGTADAIDGMVRRIRAEWPGGAIPKVVGTGGLSPVIAPLTTSIVTIDLDLTLHGLRLAADAMGMPA
jgi:type III pantothenate kinase